MRKFLAYSLLFVVSAMLTTAPLLANGHSPGSYSHEKIFENLFKPASMHILTVGSHGKISSVYLVANEEIAGLPVVVVVEGERFSPPAPSFAILPPQLIIAERKPEYYVPAKTPLPDKPFASYRWKSFHLKE